MGKDQNQERIDKLKAIRDKTKNSDAKQALDKKIQQVGKEVKK